MQERITLSSSLLIIIVVVVVVVGVDNDYLLLSKLKQGKVQETGFKFILKLQCINL